MVNKVADQQFSPALFFKFTYAALKLLVLPVLIAVMFLLIATPCWFVCCVCLDFISFFKNKDQKMIMKFARSVGHLFKWAYSNIRKNIFDDSISNFYNLVQDVPNFFRACCFVFVIAVACWFLAITVNFYTVGVFCLSLLSFAPQQMILTILINFICYSPCCLGMAFGWGSLPFLASVLFVGLGGLFYCSNDQVHNGLQLRSENLIPLYGVTAFGLLLFIIVDKFLVLQGGVGLVAALNLPVVLLVVLSVLLVLDMIFSFVSVEVGGVDTGGGATLSKLFEEPKNLTKKTCGKDKQQVGFSCYQLEAACKQLCQNY